MVGVKKGRDKERERRIEGKIEKELCEKRIKEG